MYFQTDYVLCVLTFNRRHSKSFSFCISELLAFCNVYMFTLEWPSLDNQPKLWTKGTAGKIPQDYHYLLFHCQHSLLVRPSLYILTDQFCDIIYPLSKLYLFLSSSFGNKFARSSIARNTLGFLFCMGGIIERTCLAAILNWYPMVKCFSRAPIPWLNINPLHFFWILQNESDSIYPNISLEFLEWMIPYTPTFLLNS